MSDRLDKLVQEAREDLGAREVARVDWAKVDGALLAHLERERRLERSRAVAGRGAVWGIGAAVLAAAAAVTLVVGKSHGPASLDPAPVVASAAAGNVVSIVGGGDFLVDGKPAGVGATLHLGDVVETRGASVTVDRPGKLSLVLEAGSRATVTHVQGALVLALAQGAVEAQVVPVPAGEAFAVDVEGARVAVHGTHLRVEREAAHVVVDLNEGVVIVGQAPRVGSMVGTLVTAPAHAEFTSSDAQATLQVSREPGAVRAPVALGNSAPPPPAATPAQVAAATSRPVDGRPAMPLSPRPATPSVAPAPPAPPAAPAGPQPDPNASSVLASAVRSCMAARSSAENVTVVVNTTLHVDLDADGNVKMAHFTPPVAPDVNACSVSVIYRTRFTHDGSADIPVDFKVPSSAP